MFFLRNEKETRRTSLLSPKTQKAGWSGRRMYCFPPRYFWTLRIGVLWNAIYFPLVWPPFIHTFCAWLLTRGLAQQSSIKPLDILSGLLTTPSWLLVLHSAMLFLCCFAKLAHGLNAGDHKFRSSYAMNSFSNAFVSFKSYC